MFLWQEVSPEQNETTHRGSWGGGTSYTPPGPWPMIIAAPPDNQAIKLVLTFQCSDGERWGCTWLLPNSFLPSLSRASGQVIGAPGFVFCSPSSSVVVLRVVLSQKFTDWGTSLHVTLLVVLPWPVFYPISVSVVVFRVVLSLRKHKFTYSSTS